LFLWAEDSERELNLELAQAFPGAQIEQTHSGLLQITSEMALDSRLPCLVFSRQFLPFARTIHAESIRSWASDLTGVIIESLPDNQPWVLHIEPHYSIRSIQRVGARAWHSARKHSGKNVRFPLQDSQKHRTPEAGKHRCKLIRESIIEALKDKRRHLLRQLREDSDPVLATNSLVQVLLTSPEAGFVSVAIAPLPWAQRHLLSRFPKGEVPVAVDKEAPSRAFAKLVEAELRMARSINSGETCVDLGASPGSWSYVAARRGARVIAVDRAPLREDLLRNARINFVEGDAFRYSPPHKIDWLLCDVIAAPDRTADLLLHWLRKEWCKQFVVTIKLKEVPGADPLSLLKREMPALTQEFFLTRLSANKKEVCAFGWSRALDS
jgi:23S rRNA (cytidine2498-2'-O)-methyltransferase